MEEHAGVNWGPKGIVLYNPGVSWGMIELVKIFTGKSGKRMFFVKHAGKITVESHVATFGNGRYVAENQ